MFFLFLSLILSTSIFSATPPSLNIAESAEQQENISALLNPTMMHRLNSEELAEHSLTEKENLDAIPTLTDEKKTENSLTVTDETSVLPPASRQNSGTSLFFQDIPGKKFRVLRRFSNFLNFTVHDKTDILKTYTIVVGELFPKPETLELKGKKIENALRIAFIAPIFTKEWEIFTGFDELAGFPCTWGLSENLHPLLKAALSELILYMPSLGDPHIYPRKICDISCMYPEEWQNFLKEILTNTQNPELSFFSNFGTTIQKVFDKIPGKETSGTNIYFTLAQFQPFKVSLKTQRFLSNQNLSLLTLNQKFYMYSLKNICFDNINEINAQYHKVDLPKDQKFMTNQSIAEALKKSVEEEIKSQKKLFINVQDDAQYFDIIILSRLYNFIKHSSIKSSDNHLSFYEIKEFIEKIAQRFKDQTEDCVNEQAAITYIETLINDDQQSSSDKKGKALQLVSRLKKALDVHVKKTALFSLPNNFGNVINDFNTTEMNSLFEQQTNFITRKEPKTVNFEIQLYFILKNLELFSRLHQDMVVIGKNFETYYQGSGHKDFQKVDSYEKEDPNDLILSNVEEGKTNILIDQPKEEGKTNILIDQPKEEIKALYLEFKKLITDIQKIYPNFGYLPMSLNKGETDNELLTPSQGALKDSTIEETSATASQNLEIPTVLTNPADKDNAESEEPSKSDVSKPLETIKSVIPFKSVNKRTAKSDITARK